MSYFIPSFFQKRILRYALSQLELLDTDALDLDKLDIVWGKRSTVELREVGIHTNRLAALLELPRSLAIISAQILFLRLTVPADLYKSGILVEAQGVNVHVNSDLEGQEKEPSTSPNGQKCQQERRSKDVRTGRSRSTQTYVHDPGGLRPCSSPMVDSDDEERLSEHLPTSKDLAKSYLQAEPKEKKAELQAAIAQSQHLDESQDLNEDGEETLDIGVGKPMSLPGFLADFLKGVGDRIQLRVRDVALHINLKFDLPSEGSVRSDASDKSELVTFRLTVEDLSVEAVTKLSTTGMRDEVHGASKYGSRDIRRLTLNNIEAMLISESSLFSSLAHSTGPSSPQATYTSTIEYPSSTSNLNPFQNAGSSVFPSAPGKPNRQSRQDLRSSTSGGQSEDVADSEGANDRIEHTNLTSRYSSANSSYHDSTSANLFFSGDHRSTPMVNNLADSGDLPASISTDPVKSGHPSPSSFKSRRRPTAATSHGDETPPATFHTVAPVSIPNKSDENDMDARGQNYEYPKDSKSHERSSSVPKPSRSPRSTKVVSTSESSSPASDRDSPIAEDLSQSKLFSHEEAESMYMSAISHASIGTDSREASLPGRWDFSDSENEMDAEFPAFPHYSSGSQDRHSTGLGEPQTPTVVPAPETCIVSEHGQHPGFLSHQSVDRASAPRPKIMEVRQAVAGIPTKDVQQENFPSGGSETSPGGSKSSFAMAKHILTIDTIALELPKAASEVLNNTADGGTSPSNSNIGTEIEKGQGNDTSISPLSISIGSIHLFCDMGLTRMIMLLVQQVTSMRKVAPQKSKKPGVKHSTLSNNGDLNLTVKQACWKFLDVVKGSPVKNSGADQPKQHFPTESEVLLKAQIQEFHAVYLVKDDSSRLKMSLGRVSFGYASEDVLAFDSALKMRESTRDMLAPNKDDVEITINQSTGVTKIEITTLPLHISLDLRRLDETFGWFGGLSSMLDLGNSMVSTVTIKDSTSKTSRPNKASRGVHFDSPQPDESSQAPLSQTQNKLTARLGGLVFDLIGSQTSLRFESTALRLVSRVERLGIQIDRIKLSGPYLHTAGIEPSIVVKLRSLRIEYLSTPIDDDLDSLVALLSPSNDKYERDDDILVDTLLRQRSKGGVLRVTIESLDSHLTNLGDLQCFPALTEDLKKLSKVAKYLPEDDRPGMLSLILIRSFKVAASLNSNFGVANLVAQDLELAYVTFPVLMALAVTTISLHQNDVERLIGDARPKEVHGETRLPMLMARFIGNEMEPTAKVKLYSAQFEYYVATVMAIMGYEEATEAGKVVADMVSSVATLTARDQVRYSPPNLSSQSSANINTSASAKSLKLDVVLRESIIGLNPRNSQAKALIVLTDAHFLGAMPKEEEADAILEIRKASIMVIDDVANCTQADSDHKVRSFDVKRSQVEASSDLGYVTVSSISAAKASLRLEAYPGKAIDIEFRDDLFVLETCADSTHTLQSIMSGLIPPTPPSTKLKYRTEVVPVEDMLASFTGDAFATRQADVQGGDYSNDDLSLGLDEGDLVDDEVPQNLEYVSSFYNPDPDALSQGITDSMLEDDLESLAAPSMIREIGDKNLLATFQEQTQIAPGDITLDFQDDHFDTYSTVHAKVHGWDTMQNTVQNPYGLSNSPKSRSNPLRVRVRDVHFIWNLFDGYDWQHTRDVITLAVEGVQTRATERRSLRDKRRSLDPDDQQEAVIGDFLFNSIYIGVPANRDPKELAGQVNRDIDDLVSETETHTMSSASGSPNRQGHVPRPKKQRLRLMRSKHHKMAVELKGISADIVVFAPGSGETQSSIDIRIQDLEVYDHLPTSTWRKFATYLYDIGERESGTSMVHLEILNVKPVPDLAASEIMLKATILPLRLHVDQDALDFLTRFFEFKGDSAPTQTSQSEAPFLQRAEVNSIRIKLDFKPKRVDYVGLRSGRSTEFMNFIVLQEADMVLRHAIIYGVSGFDKLGKTLNDIWMPDVKRNQLPGILAGLAPVRSLVNVGGGVRDLVIVPIREYRKDGRVVRSFQKGAVAFAKTTTTELVKLGAKLAIGTQTVLQGAEGLLNPSPSLRQDVSSGWEDAEMDEEEAKQISLYADQPVGVIQGLRGGYASLEHDLLMAKDAIIAMPGEIMETGTAGGAAKALLRNAPTVILRPAMGVSKALGQTLMGATNSLDPGNKRRVEDVSPQYL